MLNKIRLKGNYYDHNLYDINQPHDYSSHEAYSLIKAFLLLKSIQEPQIGFI